MAIANICLLFDGNCEEAFNYYKSVFGSEFTFVGRYGDVPPMEGAPQLTDEEKAKIENICLPLSKETFLMGADGLESLGRKAIAGNNFSIYLQTESEEEINRLFDGLSKDGHIGMPVSKAHWGDYFGMCTDKFGITWFINYSPDK